MTTFLNPTFIISILIAITPLNPYGEAQKLSTANVVGIVILLASGFGILVRLFRQPTILAYIVTGAVIGYLGFFNLGELVDFGSTKEIFERSEQFMVGRYIQGIFG